MKETLAPRTQNTSATRGKQAEPLFEPLGYFMVRAPLFPLEAYQRLQASHGEDALSAENPRVRLAVGVGSLSLLDDLERAASSRRDQLRRERKLLRYLIRMSTRPTPYGLFAGVALGRWGEATNLRIADPAAQMRARLDMGWLMPLIWKLEALPDVRQHLCFVANTAVYIRGGRAFLHERAASSTATETKGVSVRATAAVKRALELTRQPIAYADLTSQLLASIPGATAEKVEALLTELWKQTLLLSDLRPPLTGDVHPAHYLCHRLAAIPSTAALAKQLATITKALSAWEAVELLEKLPRYRLLNHQIEQCAEAFAGVLSKETTLSSSSEALSVLDDDKGEQVEEEGAGKALVQVDMGMALESRTLAAPIGTQVARMAEVLLRVSSLPRGSMKLATYRQSFLERYGEAREVPLVELLDPNFGLGAPGALRESAHPLEAEQQTRRKQALIELALTAQQERRLVANLDEEMLKRLETWVPDPATAPYSLDINIFIAASSAAEVQAGNYQLALGPNVGGQQAGCNFGRFAYLFGDEGITALRETASCVSRLAPDVLFAELVYLPSRSRTSNVTIRPAIYPYELTYAASSGVAASNMIPLNELVVGLRDNRFYLRWPGKNVQVIARAGHMLNTMGAPPVVQLLSDISTDGIVYLTPFDWGEAAYFPFLPRVQMDRFVLSLARWRITSFMRDRQLPAASSEAFQAALLAWRERWNVPRHVYLCMFDNRLLLDLECPQQSEELRAEVQKLQEGNVVLLQEVFPTLDQTWVEGPGGQYVTEYIFPLIRTEAAREGKTDVPGPIPSLEQRLKSVGSDWLFMKLYCGSDLQEELLAGPLRDFGRDALNEGFAADWFFIRYRDPDPHIRLRFRGDPKVLTGKLLPVLGEWGTWLMTRGSCLKYSFDTYDREIERYGGLAGIALAEQVFGADSRAVTDLLAAFQANTLDLDRTLLAVLSADDLLDALGASTSARLAWYRQRVTERHRSGQMYRQKSAQLRSLLSNPAQALEALPGGSAVCAILTHRRAALEVVARQIAELDAAQVLERPLTTLYASYFHMHCNRLLGTDRSAEDMVAGLLLRTREGLERTPVV
jgi:thiopeptide-type bacteriocin biosynthesis protein